MIQLIGDYVIPTWAVCPLEYGEPCDKQDEVAIKNFLEGLRGEGWSNVTFRWPQDMDAEAYFARSNDINDLGANVVDVEVYGEREPVHIPELAWDV